MADAKEASYLFYPRFYPTLEQRLAAGGGRTLYQHLVRVVTRDDIMRKLDTNDPAMQIYFGNDETDTDRSPVWEITGQKEREWMATVLETPAIGRSTTPGPFFGKPWIIGSEPINWLMVFVIKWYVDHGTEQQQRAAVMFLTLHFYASLVYKYYNKGYQPNVMAFAMNSLSEKFTLKQEGTVFKALMVTAWRSHQKYVDLLRDPHDNNVRLYFTNLRGRLNGMCQSLANHYYGVLGTGSFLNQTRERDPSRKEMEGGAESGRILGLADKLAQSFVGEPVPQRAVELAAKMADTPRLSLASAIDSIRAREGPVVREAMQLILEVFFEERGAGPDDLRTRGFLGFAVALYARSNTKDGRIERIKAILDGLLAAHSEFYTRTNRDATKGSFRKACYLFLVLFMQMRS
jgi:hypothetical protein